MRLGILAEIGILKFPQENYQSQDLWLVIDRTRYSWEALTKDGFCCPEIFSRHYATPKY